MGTRQGTRLLHSYVILFVLPPFSSALRIFALGLERGTQNCPSTGLSLFMDHLILDLGLRFSKWLRAEQDGLKELRDVGSPGGTWVSARVALDNF